MQKLLSIILVFSIFSYQSYHSLIYINYMINKTYYAEVLCENKDNPEKPHCNGKCYLKKQLDKQKPLGDQNPFSEAPSISFYPELVAILQAHLKLQPQQNFRDSFKNHICFLILSPHLADIFHPPKSLII